MPRVLIVDFGAVARRGLLEFLEDAGMDVMTESSEDLVVATLRRTSADVVVLNLDADGAAERARALAEAFPDTKVIVCSAERPEMLVLPPNGGDSYMSTLTSRRLEAEMGVS